MHDRYFDCALGKVLIKITQCDIRHGQLHNITLITNKIHTLCTQQTKAFPWKYDIKLYWSDDPN